MGKSLPGDSHVCVAVHQPCAPFSIQSIEGLENFASQVTRGSSEIMSNLPILDSSTNSGSSVVFEKDPRFNGLMLTTSI